MTSSKWYVHGRTWDMKAEPLISYSSPVLTMRLVGRSSSASSRPWSREDKQTGDSTQVTRWRRGVGAPTHPPTQGKRRFPVRGVVRSQGGRTRGLDDPGAGLCQQGPRREETHTPSDELGAVLWGPQRISQCCCCCFLNSIFFFRLQKLYLFLKGKYRKAYTWKYKWKKKPPQVSHPEIGIVNILV